MQTTEFENIVVPQDIIEAAIKLEKWFKIQGINKWELCGVCSRDHAINLKMILDQKPLPPQVADIINQRFWELV